MQIVVLGNSSWDLEKDREGRKANVRVWYEVDHHPGQPSLSPHKDSERRGGPWGCELPCTPRFVQAAGALQQSHWVTKKPLKRNMR